MNRTFEWGVDIATFLSVLSIVPRHCARLTYFFRPKLRKTSAVLVALKLITLGLRRLQRAVSAPHALPLDHSGRGDIPCHTREHGGREEG